MSTPCSFAAPLSTASTSFLPVSVGIFRAQCTHRQGNAQLHFFANPSFPRRTVQCLAANSTRRKNSSNDYDAIIIGSGFGGLCCAAALTAYGYRPLVLESHYSPGGVAHGFKARSKAGTFKFDTGPSFFCGLSTNESLCPVKHALDAVDEKVECTSYDRFCIDDLKVGTVHVCEDERETLRQVEGVAGKDAALQLDRFYKVMHEMHASMDVPAIALRGDWRIIPVIASRWAKNMLGLLPYVNDVKKPVGRIMDRVGVTNPFVRRVLDTEAFLLSGLKADKTITAEIAFMVGERAKRGSIEYPIGGAKAIIDALVRGIEKRGGEVRLRSHVHQILVENGVAVGVELKAKQQRLYAKHIFSNASIWDTVLHLLPEHSLPASYRRAALNTPTVESFMHAHIAIPNYGLENIIGHHAVVIDSDEDITVPGNVVMISIPTMWSPDLAPEGWHIVHAYTLEEYDRWLAFGKNREAYEAAKEKAAQPLFQAIRHVVPDLDDRLKKEGSIVKLGSPLTHARFNRRYKGTYGAAIDAGNAEFEWPSDIPIERLKRCSDSAFPGIGVPSSAAAGLIAANELVGVKDHIDLIEKVFPR